MNNDIVNILRNNIMITPDDADRAAREIEELHKENQRLRKELDKNARDGKYNIPPTYNQRQNIYNKTEQFWHEAIKNDIVKQLQAYARTITYNQPAHELISKAIAEIIYLRKNQNDLPY